MSGGGFASPVMHRTKNTTPRRPTAFKGKFPSDPDPHTSTSYKMFCNVRDVSQFSINRLFIHHSIKLQCKQCLAWTETHCSTGELNQAMEVTAAGGKTTERAPLIPQPPRAALLLPAVEMAVEATLSRVSGATSALTRGSTSRPTSSMCT